MKPASGVVIETGRLTLRCMRFEDLDALAGVWCDAHAMRFYPRAHGRDELMELVERQLRRYENDGHGLYTVVLKSTGEIVGDCGPTVQEIETGPEIEVGYHFIPKYWGQGYATEAARAARDWAFTHLACARVISLIRPENAPSQKVAQRNGMSVTSRVIWRDLEHDIWAITRAEWNALGEREGTRG